MKLVFCLAVLTLGCAHGSDFKGTLDDSSSTDDSAEEVAVPPTQSVVAPAPINTLNPPVNPLLTLRNQGVMYSVDQTFWEGYINTIQYGTQSVDQELGCYNDGTFRLVGQVVDTHTLVNQADQLLVDFEMTFDHCLIPDSSVTINLIYTGKVRITGKLDDGAFENNLLIRADALELKGMMKLDNGKLLPVDERCKLNFIDNFHESNGIGGLYGWACGEKVGVTESDPND